MSDYVTRTKRTSRFRSTLTSKWSHLTCKRSSSASSGQALLSRPDKLRISSDGGIHRCRARFRRQDRHVLGKHLNSYAQKEAPARSTTRRRHPRSRQIVLPGADLLLSRVYDELIAEVTDSKHVGQGVVDGVECEHLAFRTPEVDWQVWVKAASRPVPRKYVITSKQVDRRAAIHVAHQGVEGRVGRRRCIRLQAAGRCQTGRIQRVAPNR